MKTCLPISSETSGCLPVEPGWASESAGVDRPDPARAVGATRVDVRRRPLPVQAVFGPYVAGVYRRAAQPPVDTSPQIVSYDA